MQLDSRVFRAIFVLLIAHVALGAAIWFTSPGAETVWFHVGRWLAGVQASDSWKPIEIAYARARAGSTTIYDDVFFTGAVKFQYPLTVVAMFGGVSRATLNVVSWAATALTAVISSLLLRTSLARETGTSTSARKNVLAGVLTFLAALSFYPVVKAYSLGQIQTCVTVAFAILLLAWQHERKGIAGVALGLMLLIKPGSAPLLLWGAARREWRFVLAAAITGTCGVVFALPHFSLQEQASYLRVLSFIGRRGELFYPNQSINGLLNRWVHRTGSLQWHPDTFAVPNAFVAIGTTVALIVLIVVVLWCVPRVEEGTVLDLSAMMLASTVAAPVAWEHHYGVLAPILAATAPRILSVNAMGRLTGGVLLVGTLVSANFFQVANRFDGTPFNVLQSYLLGAALAIFALLLATATRQPA